MSALPGAAASRSRARPRRVTWTCDEPRVDWEAARMRSAPLLPVALSPHISSSLGKGVGDTTRPLLNDQAALTSCGYHPTLRSVRLDRFET
jgi:hypothetical protein